MDAFSDSTITVSSGNVVGAITDRAHSTPTRAAFVHVDDLGRPDRVVSTGRLHELAGTFASGLRERGVGRGSRLLVAIPAGLDRAIVTLAVLRLGGVVCSVDPRSSRAELAEIARTVEPDGIVGTARIMAQRLTVGATRSIDIAIVTGRRRVPGADSMADVLESAVGAVDDDARMDDGELAFLDCSSGRARSHGQLRSRFAALGTYVPDDGSARAWTVDPLAELLYLTRGAGLVLATDEPVRGLLPDPLRLHRLIQRARVTSMVLTPASFAQLTRAPGRIPLDGLELLCVLGIPVSATGLDLARALAPNAEVVVVATTSEAGPFAAVNADEALERREQLREEGGAYLGQPLEGVDARVVRERSGPIELEPGAALEDWTVEPGTAGELLVSELGGSAPAAAAGVDAPAGALDVVEADGRRWLRTGLVVRADADGGLWLLGLRGQAWSLGGRRYWALEVETPIADEPEVERAVVCMPKFEGGSREFKNASAVLAVEPAPGFGRTDARDAALRSLRRRGLDAMVEVRSLKSVPTLRADRATVDTEALHKQLKPQNVEDY